ncbi:MAG: hypothetical protein WCN81_04450 [Actinomycetes bacterium]
MRDEAGQAAGPTSEGTGAAGASDPGAAAGTAADEALEGEIVDEGQDHGAGWDPAAEHAEGGAYGLGGGTRGHGGPHVTFTAASAGAGSAPAAHRDRGALTFGAVLVAVGAVLLAGRLNHVVAAGGPALWLGAGFLVWWIFSGNFGLLVPAGVLGGLGAGMMLGETGFYGNAVALGLGAGFVAIFLLDTLRQRHRSGWWPLVPGAVLIAAGLLQNTTGWGSLGDLGWPLFLIVAGVVVVGVALAGRGRRS